MTRLYERAGVSEGAGGFVPALDARPVLTPARAPMRLPCRGLAEAIAGEWAAQGDEVAPATMPLTRLAATAIDRVAPRRRRVVDEIAGFGESDLLCYRAAAPPELVARQAAAWQPLLDRAAERFGARLAVTQGVAPLCQERAALEALRRRIEACDDMVLAALHSATTITGSAVIGLLLAAGEIELEAAWEAAEIDNVFQSERWGADAAAEAASAARRRDLQAAARFLALLGS
jgi:chaperone required for assembly of F1-ATPase